MALASLVLGIISIPTFGLALVGGIIGLTLGISALRRAHGNPAAYGGRGLAVGGIVISSISLVLPGLIGVLIPNFMFSEKAGREVSALQTVKDIGSAQMLYSVTKGKGQFTDLQTLISEGLTYMDDGPGSVQKSGYLFNSAPLNVEGRTPMFDTTARPVSTGAFGKGNRSFYSNETMALWEAEGGDPPAASPSDRVPKSGSIIE